MRLSEDSWISSAGLTPEWRGVTRRRAEDALRKLRVIVVAFLRQAPASAKKKSYAAGMAYFLKHRSPERDRLACDPAFDYWLFLWEKHFSSPSPDENWQLQFGLFQGFGATLALKTGEKRSFDMILDPDAHLHLYGSPVFLEFPAGMRLGQVRLDVSGGRFKVKGKMKVRRFPEIAAGLTAQDCGFLTVEAVTMHGLARLDAARLKRFAEVLGTALAQLEERSPALHAEMTDMVTAFIPLVNPKTHGSVSSSYVNLRGAICLSHAESPLLQAETLIHEFCHQKMNQLLLVDPVLLPGQAGQVFYSPWRADARRLRGLILGAHAFLNVADYLIKSLSLERYPLREHISIMCNAARRLFEVQLALDSAVSYGSYTEFGGRFIMGMRRELQGLFHAVQWFPAELIKEARERCEEHRGKHCLPLTGIHKSADFTAKVVAENYKRRP